MGTHLLGISAAKKELLCSAQSEELLTFFSREDPHAEGKAPLTTNKMYTYHNIIMSHKLSKSEKVYGVVVCVTIKCSGFRSQ